MFGNVVKALIYPPSETFHLNWKGFKITHVIAGSLLFIASAQEISYLKQKGDDGGVQFVPN